MYAVVLLSIRHLRGVDVAWIGLVNHVASVVCLWPLVIGKTPMPHGIQWAALIGLGAVQLAIPYMIFAWAVREVESNEASSDHVARTAGRADVDLSRLATSCQLPISAVVDAAGGCFDCGGIRVAVWTGAAGKMDRQSPGKRTAGEPARVIPSSNGPDVRRAAWRGRRQVTRPAPRGTAGAVGRVAPVGNVPACSRGLSPPDSHCWRAIGHMANDFRLSGPWMLSRLASSTIDHFFAILSVNLTSLDAFGGLDVPAR